MLGLLLVLVAVSIFAFLLLTRAKASRTPSPRGRPLLPGQDAAQEAYWLARLHEITRGNQGAIERGLLAKGRRFPQLKRWESMRLLYLDYLRDRS